jgi:hypothetical protein
MNSWAEKEIGFVYYGGLVITLVIIIVVLLLLQPRFKVAIQAMVGERTAAFWGHALRITLILLGMVGALSVTFYGCSVGQYEHLLSQPLYTVGRGFTQVSRGMIFFGRTFLAWFLFFGLYFLLRKRPPNS